MNIHFPAKFEAIGKPNIPIPRLVLNNYVTTLKVLIYIFSSLSFK